jgi:hypothetical protein
MGQDLQWPCATEKVASREAENPGDMWLAKTLLPQHASLIEIVRLLARQAAKDDIAAQRATPPEE